MSLHQLYAASDPGIQVWGDSIAAGISGSIEQPYRWTNRLERMFRPARSVQNFGVGGESAAQIRARMVAWLPTNNQIIGIVAGRNGVLTLTPAEIVADIQLMIDHVGDDRYFVTTVLPILDGSEDPGDANRTKVNTLNALFASTWPNNVIDWVSLLDSTSLRNGDFTHVTAAGQALQAQLVYDFIVDKGW